MLYLRNLLIAALVLPFQYVVVPILLLTRWNGRTTWFGNEKWGRGHGHFEHHTETYWEEFVWLTYRNPRIKSARVLQRRGVCRAQRLFSISSAARP